MKMMKLFCYAFNKWVFKAEKRQNMRLSIASY